MTETTQPTADEAVQQAGTTALPTENPVDHGMFVPDSTRDNYLAVIRDQAAVRGEDPDTVRDDLVKQFRRLHRDQPLDGYDHLAGWLAGADLTAGVGPTGMQQLIGRTLESARRDPQQAVQGDQALVEIGVARQLQADEEAAAAAVAPSVDPSLGMLPNSGPLPVPADVLEDSSRDGSPADDGGDDDHSPTPSATAATDTSPTPDASPAPTVVTPSTPPSKRSGGVGSGSGDNPS